MAAEKHHCSLADRDLTTSVVPGIGVIRTGADMPTTVVEENRSTESRLIYGYLSLFILYYTPKNTDWEIIFFGATPAPWHC